VKLEVVPGRKSKNDKLVRVWAYGEVLSFKDLLFILGHYFRSEEDYYPKPQYEGSTMLLKAILEIYSGIPLETVLRKYQLDRKTSRTVIVEVSK
jgi:hypothetical protein